MPSWLCFLFFLSLQVLVMIEGARTAESYLCRDSSCSQDCTVESSAKVGECQTVNVNVSYKVTDCSGDEGKTELYADGHCGKLKSESTFPIGNCQKIPLSANSTATVSRILKCTVDPVVIVLACVGGALFLGAVVAGVFWWWCRRRQMQQRNAPSDAKMQELNAHFDHRSVVYGNPSAAQRVFSAHSGGERQPKEQLKKRDEMLFSEAVQGSVFDDPSQGGLFGAEPEQHMSRNEEQMLKQQTRRRMMMFN